MGTINYKTSQYITMGIKPCDSYDLLNDLEFVKEELQPYADDRGVSMEDAAEWFAHEYNEDDYINAEAILEKYGFSERQDGHYFRVYLEYGYYDGFSLMIDSDNKYFWTCGEKQIAQREITALRKCLHELADVGLVEVWPGWCMKYSNYADTIKAIDAAIREMREDVRKTPLAQNYKHGW